MRPFEPSLLQRIPQARSAAAQLATVGVVSGVLVLAQAWTVTQLVVALVTGGDVGSPAAWLVATFAGRGLLAWLRERLAARNADRVVGEIRRRRLSAWLGVPVEDRPNTATAGALATEGADAVEPYVARYLPALVTAAVLPPLVLVALFATDWISGLIVLLTLPLLPVFAALIGQHTQEAVERRFAGSVRLAGHFADVVRGLPTLVGYQRAEAQADQVERVGQQHRRATMGTLRIAFMSSAALELLSTLSVAIVAVGVGLRLAAGGLPLEVGLLAILLAPEAYWPIRRVGQEFHAAADGAAALDALLVDDEPSTGHRTLPVAAEQSVREGVRVEGLTYAYPDSDRPVFDGLSFRLAPGLTVLAAPSGAGKTTLLELLAGVRTPTGGHLDAPRAHLVGQRPFIAPGTLAQNLGLGLGHSPARPSSLRDIPPSTVLGDEGFGLSAGQRARIALERAAHSDAPLLLFDEPTAHLDASATAALIDRLHELAHTRTVLVASHDPRVRAAADRVLDLSEWSRPGGSLRGVLSLSKGSRSLDHRAPPHPGGAAGQQPGAEPRGIGRGVDGSGWRAGAQRRPDRLSRPIPLGEATARNSMAGPGHERWRVLGAGAIGAAAASAGVALTATSGWLVVRAAEQPLILTLMVAIVLVRTFGVARPALRYLERLRSHDAALRDLRDQRVAAYRALIPLTPARLGRRHRADLLTAFVRDLDDVVEAQVRVTVPIVTVLTTGFLATILTGWISGPVGWIVAAQVAGCLGVAAVGLHGALGEEAEVVDRRAEIHRAARFITANTADLQSISARQWALDRLAVAATRAPYTARGRALTAAGVPLVGGLAVASAAAVLAPAVASGELSAPVAALLVMTPLALGEVLDLLPDVVGGWARSRVAGQRVRTLLEQEPAVTDTGAASCVSTKGELTTQDVVASWSDKKQIPLPSITIRAGEHIAVTGPNGCGKSTLLAVLARHLDPTSGTVRLDGREVRDLALEDVRRQIALVDEPHVFAGTIRANLLLARPGAHDTAILDALHRAGLGDWFASLPAGLDTDLGADVRTLSGGEQSRLALARALLSDRPILMLDEPVAHLDHPTAIRVLADLHATARDRTIVLVTHQCIGEDGCDRVLRWGADPARTTSAARAQERTAV